jgi:hypothetical protein
LKNIDEIDEEINKETMDEREAIKEAALQERISKERKRRQTDGDVENLEGHPYPEGYVRRLKRSRAEALCRALDIAMPPTTNPQKGLRSAQLEGSSAGASAVAENNARRRKRRTEVSSDESSDSSSSEEEDSSSEGNSGDDSSSSDDDGSDADSATDTSDESGESSASGDDSN